MSPTLLEVVAGIVIVILGWQIGIGLTPLLLQRWQKAKAQLDGIDHAAPPIAGHTTRKENNDERATGIQQETGTDEQ